MIKVNFYCDNCEKQLEHGEYVTFTKSFKSTKKVFKINLCRDCFNKKFNVDIKKLVKENEQ